MRFVSVILGTLFFAYAGIGKDADRSLRIMGNVYQKGDCFDGLLTVSGERIRLKWSSVPVRSFYSYDSLKNAKHRRWATDIQNQELATSLIKVIESFDYFMEDGDLNIGQGLSIELQARSPENPDYNAYYFGLDENETAAIAMQTFVSQLNRLIASGNVPDKDSKVENLLTKNLAKLAKKVEAANALLLQNNQAFEANQPFKLASIPIAEQESEAQSILQSCLKPEYFSLIFGRERLLPEHLVVKVGAFVHYELNQPRKVTVSPYLDPGKFATLFPASTEHSLLQFIADGHSLASDRPEFRYRVIDRYRLEFDRGGELTLTEMPLLADRFRPRKVENQVRVNYLNNSLLSEQLLAENQAKKLATLDFESIAVKAGAAKLTYKIEEKKFVLPVWKLTDGSWLPGNKRYEHQEYHRADGYIKNRSYFRPKE